MIARERKHRGGAYRSRILPGLAMLRFLLSACVPQAERPLTEPYEQPLDRSLLGSWFWRHGSETGFLHVGLDFRSGLLRLVMLDFNRDSELEVSEFVGHTSILGAHRYLNLKWLRPEDGITGYLFVQYRREHDALAISIADSRVFEEAVEGGVLQGVLKPKNKLFGSVRITAAATELQRFLMENDDRLFPEYQRVRRLPLPGEEREVVAE